MEITQIETPRYYGLYDFNRTSPATERIRAEGSYLYPPEGPGLGVELDEAKMAAMTVAKA